MSANLTGTISADTTSDTPAVGADGCFVAFLSDAPDLTTNAPDGSYQVLLRDTLNSATRLVSVDLNGVVSGETGGAIPTISADGRYIAFDSFDGGHVAADNNNAFDVFVRDMTADITELISQANATAQSLTANGISSVSGNSVSADVRFAGRIGPTWVLGWWLLVRPPHVRTLGPQRVTSGSTGLCWSNNLQGRKDAALPAPLNWQ